MENELDPRELARTKKAARATRIRRIRRRVAIYGASLTAIFSGAVLARGQLDQPQDPLPKATTTATVAEIPGSSDYAGEYPYGGNSDDDHGSDGDHESDGGEFGQIIQTATETLSNVLGGAQTSATGSAQSAPAPAPAPLTTSQS